MQRLVLLVMAACASTPRPKAVVNVGHGETRRIAPHADCDAWWPLGETQGVCARGEVFEMTGPTDLTKPIPRTQVYDATGDELVVAGTCGYDVRIYDDPVENATYTDNAICILDGPHAPGDPSGGSIIYIGADTLSKPGYPRGVVAFSDGVIATNGLSISIGNYGNKSGNHDPDVQTQLVAANIRPPNACTWTVREALHRSRAGAYEMTFNDCASKPVTVTVEFDSLGDFVWRRVDRR